jgi:hypothetical protein
MTEIEEAAMDDGWNLPWEGGCRCGRVRIRVTKPPLLTGACHCTGCQTMSASAFSLTVTVPSDGFEVIAGEPVIGGLHGPEAHHHHCPHCLSWMFTKAEGMDWFVNVRPSMLDEHRWFVPFAEFWTCEKLPWASTPARHSYETVPELAAFGPLIEAFAQEGVRPGRD